MRTKYPFSALISALAILAGPAVVRAAAQNAAADDSKSPKTASSAPAAADSGEGKQSKNPHGWPVLKKGMPGDEIVRAIGKPDSIKPMDTPEGKAEVWVYRRLANSVTRQSAVTTQSVPAFNGIGTGNDSSGSVMVPSYRMERVDVYQVSSLLIFEGKLVTATQKVEQESHFE